MKKVLVSIAALLFSSSLALAANISLLTGPQDSSQLQATVNQVIQAVNSGVVGKLYGNGVVVATGTGTSEQTLYTYTLPANTLANVGDVLKVRCGAITAATANNKTLKLYFGATSFSTGVVASNAGAFDLNLTIIRTAAATQMVWGAGLGGTGGITPIIPTYTAGTDDFTTALTIKCTGTDGTSAAADISGKFMTVEMVK